MTTDPGGNFLYVTNYADGNVAAFSIEPGAGAIAAIGGSPFGSGAGALAITIDPTGTFAYVANETAQTIAGYSINPATGALAALSGFPLSTGSNPEAVTVDPAGRYLYAANVIAKNDLSSFSITPSDRRSEAGLERRRRRLSAERRHRSRRSIRLRRQRGFQWCLGVVHRFGHRCADERRRVRGGQPTAVDRHRLSAAALRGRPQADGLPGGARQPRSGSRLEADGYRRSRSTTQLFLELAA